jgi:hypothetical protein
MEKKSTKDMFDALVTLYHCVNISHKLLLKNKLTTTCMSDIDTMASNLMKIIELRDELGVIGDEV